MNFKLFRSETINGLVAEMQSFTNNNNLLEPKSIGIEYFKGQSTFVASLGYDTLSANEPKTKITFDIEDVGEITNLESLETRIAELHAGHENDVICHELYASPEDRLEMVVMRKAATATAS